MVGLAEFESAASWSRTRRSTKLSHSPLFPIRVTGTDQNWSPANQTGLQPDLHEFFWITEENGGSDGT